MTALLPRHERHGVLNPAHHAELPKKVLRILSHGVHPALPLLEDLLHPDAEETRQADRRRALVSRADQAFDDVA